MGPLLHSEDKTLDFSLKVRAKLQRSRLLMSTFYFPFYYYFRVESISTDCCNLNIPGRALEHGSKSIVMKGRGISCASSSSSVVNYGRVSLSLVL